MKTSVKYLSVLMALFMTLSSLSAQEENGISGNSEIKINGLTTVLKFPMFSYEYLINDGSSVGLSAGFPLDEIDSFRYIATPFYRVFFSEKKAAGFFIEGSSSLFGYREDAEDPTTEFGIGLGIAVGGKFITSNGLVGELFLGIGRPLNIDNLFIDAYPRIGITIGKRF